MLDNKQEPKAGSEVWHAARAKGIGGSEVAAILGISPYMTAFQLWEYKTNRKIQPDIGNLPHVKRGVMGEEVARMMIEREHEVSFKPKMWQIEGTPFRATDDGYSLDLEVFLEIKCMGKDAHEKMKLAQKTNDTSAIPAHYLCQCQYNLFVSQAKECWFYSFRPEDETLYRVIVKPDAKEQKFIKKAVMSFWFDHVVADEPPALTDKDYQPISTPKFASAAERFIELKTQKDAIEKELEKVQEELMDEVGDRPAVQGHGLRVRTYSRKGNVQYKNVPELQGVDLEAYRAKPSSVTQIKLAPAFTVGNA